MKFTLSWLKEHLETETSLDKIVETLTAIGLEVERVKDSAKLYKGFVVGLVKNAEQHPDADRLKLCTVSTGTEEVQVVCGAPNVRAGLKGVFAPVGVTMPDSGETLKKGRIRGVNSYGMLCSMREMTLSDDHAAIIELPEETKVGASFAEVMGLDDAMIEIDLTPNRADCASVRGIARDLAAAGLGQLKPLQREPVQGVFDSPVTWKRADDAKTACPYIVGYYFKNVQNGDSPEWLQKRLKSIGCKSISTLVDITNYLTFDLGRPLHIFDADKLSGDLTLRLAKEGEEIVALDEEKYALTTNDLVIADDKGVQAVAGVTGALHSGVTDATKNVFLEIALFNPARIAKTGQRLNFISDARYRFERGVDPCSVQWGADVAVKMIQELCGGTVSHKTDIGMPPEPAKVISFSAKDVQARGGVTIEPKILTKILTTLGFEEESKGRFTVPSWRADVQGRADMVEEILRIYGYHHIPCTRLDSPGKTAKKQPFPALLAARGLMEAVTWSFMSSDFAAPFGFTDETRRLKNPISTELDVMRPSLLPNLIQAAAQNAARGHPNAAFFESGPAWLEKEEIHIAVLRTGQAVLRDWNETARAVDIFDVKADVIAILNAAGISRFQIKAEAPEWYHPKRSGTLYLGPHRLACFGEIHPAILDKMSVNFPVVGAEIFRNHFPKTRRPAAKSSLRLSQFQTVTRDFAFIVENEVKAETLIRAVSAADKKLIASVTIFDIYKEVEDGKKSVALSVTLQPAEKTLTDSEIEAIAKNIVQKAAEQTGARLRTESA